MAGKKVQQIGFRCMCCRDSGVIPAHILRKHLDNYEFYGTQNIADVPVLCKACDNIYTTVETSRGLQYQPRYPLACLDQSLTVEDCRYIHKQEAEEWSRLAQQLDQTGDERSETIEESVLAEQTAQIRQRLSDITKDVSVKPSKVKPAQWNAKVDESKLMEALGL